MSQEQSLITRTVAPLPPWMQQLRDAVSAELKADDLNDIVKAFVAKAKQGDEKAARFVVEYLLGGKFAPTQITVHNHYGSEPCEEPERPAGSSKRPALRRTPSDRERIHTYLEAAGPTKASVIAADLGLPSKTVAEALDCEWFRLDGQKWSIARARSVKRA